MQTLTDLESEYLFYDEGSDERYRMLIDLGKGMETMPTALKTEQTLVKGCASQVWTYPIRMEDGRLHFLADGTSAFTKGVIALVLLTVQDQQPDAILKVDIEGALQPFKLDRFLTKNRVMGIPNMIALIRETAARYATA